MAMKSTFSDDVLVGYVWEMLAFGVSMHTYIGIYICAYKSRRKVDLFSLYRHDPKYVGDAHFQAISLSDWLL